MFWSSKKWAYKAHIVNDPSRSLFLDAVFDRQFKQFRNLTSLNFSGESSYCYMVSITNLIFQNSFRSKLEIPVFVSLQHLNRRSLKFTLLTELKYLINKLITCMKT